MLFFDSNLFWRVFLPIKLPEALTTSVCSKSSFFFILRRFPARSSVRGAVSRLRLSSRCVSRTGYSVAGPSTTTFGARGFRNVSLQPPWRTRFATALPSAATWAPSREIFLGGTGATSDALVRVITTTGLASRRRRSWHLTGVGLANIRERLHTLYGTRITLLAAVAINGTHRATIRLPTYTQQPVWRGLLPALILGDRPLARRGIRQLLEREPDVAIIGEARNVDARAVRLLRAHR